MEGILGLLLWALVLIIIIIIVYAVLKLILNEAFGQETTTKAPPAVEPTIVNTPTPTQSEPNLQYLPQKAYVQAYKPEVGIPPNQQPLQAVPQVVPVPQTAQGIGGVDIGSIMGYLATIVSTGAYIKGHLVGKKTDKVEETTKEVAQTQVKQIGIQQGSLELQYENMPQKGNEITNREDIRLANVESLKEKALDTAAKA